ncbi:hypothetical protein QUH73_11635 [Labilibaculum sp. K2S]|uniref:hypothetical protein n=1 Tax=Labilibaculum sp. K2S TaxID=3056386 RepID=UPI0025A39818|nr:hypothetical protein [Labilibaculum sp. K2S]MDM8160467.1 hypothetical protein [Labilibaculum sp. K2S]
MARKNRIVSFHKMKREVVHLIHKKYPLGWDDEIKFYNLGAGKSFYAFNFITEEYNYLVKVDMNVDYFVEGVEFEEPKNEEADSY